MIDNRRATVARRRNGNALAAIVLLLSPVVVSCTDEATNDRGDLASFCAVVRERDLDAVLTDERRTGRTGDPSDTAAVSEAGGVDPQFSDVELDAFARSFADIVEQDSPGAIRDDAERYAAALRAAIDDGPPTGADREEALAAASRLTTFVTEECPPA